MTTKKTEKDFDLELVTGRFKHNEVSGGSIKFFYRKYKDQKQTKFVMTDGEVYEVPRCVAEHLSNDCWHPVHIYKVDKEGKPEQEIGTKKNRFEFASIGFISSPPKKHLVTVKNL